MNNGSVSGMIARAAAGRKPRVAKISAKKTIENSVTGPAGLAP
jgi:hypothetical protein